MTRNRITMSEFADLAGVKRRTLSAYVARRQLGVPQPVEKVGSTPLFRRDEAERWVARDRRKVTTAPADQ